MDYFEFDNLLLTESSKTKSYVSRKNEDKIEDWGQRKLLLSEIEFFSLYCPNEKIICLYIGAAPGDHIEFLSKMFTNIEFHLYDKNENYDFNVKETERIKIFEQYFTDSDVKKYKNSKLPIFLISDFISIRKNFYSKNKIDPIDKKLFDKYEPELDLQLEKEIWADMERQQKWVKEIKPQEALLKFRLPYPNKGFQTDENGNVEYLAGKIYFQIWEGATSTELRLVPDNTENEYKMKKYNLVKFDDQVFYHNTETRLKKKYYNIFNGSENPINEKELLNDFDSTAEVAILIMYLNKFDITNDIEKKVILLSNKITEFLSTEKNRKLRTLESLRGLNVPAKKLGLSNLIKPSIKINSETTVSDVIPLKKGGLKITKIDISKEETELKKGGLKITKIDVSEEIPQIKKLNTEEEETELKRKIPPPPPIKKLNNKIVIKPKK